MFLVDVRKTATHRTQQGFGALAVLARDKQQAGFQYSRSPRVLRSAYYPGAVTASADSAHAMRCMQRCVIITRCIMGVITSLGRALTVLLGYRTYLYAGTYLPCSA
jgi:hypothetical protein